jgi:hypothetical protein
MAKLMIICLVCITVAASLMTSCTAARGLPPSWRSGEKPLSTERTTSRSKPLSPTMADSNEGAIDDDWEQLYEEEIMGPCMEDAKGSEYKRPCHRMLVDYPPPGHNKNPKGP